jgi:UDP-N-acetylmuramoylalanine--D-glutamate ligase
MTPAMHSLINQRVTVMGLGRFGGGIAVARWLVGQGARVLVTDKDSAEKLAESVAELAGLPIEFRLGEHREEDFTGADLVVASPAVTLNNAYLEAGRAAGVPITTEIRLFVERCPARRICGVTGTKGKSTTTAMLGAMLARRFRVYVGGNIGGSLLADLLEIGADDVVVLELSSYMLEHLRAMRWSPHVGLITMLARDHVEWHGSVDAYLAAKGVLLKFQRPGDFAVINAACPQSAELAKATPATKVFFAEDSSPPFDLAIPGVHNQVNAQGAFAAAACLGVTRGEAEAALREFRPLPHRLQLVHEAGGVRFYNDSIATIPEAAVAALESFPPDTVLQIIGGRLKDIAVDDMCAALAARAKAVLCIGERGIDLAERVRLASAALPVKAHECGDLATAVALATSLATPGDVVLLSPGCKSQDQFVNFEARGDAFARLVRAE